MLMNFMLMLVGVDLCAIHLVPTEASFPPHPPASRDRGNPTANPGRYGNSAYGGRGMRAGTGGMVPGPARLIIFLSTVRDAYERRGGGRVS
jgi:hypothetical protein